MDLSFETILTGLDHPEGVVWGPDGRVYAGGEAGQVYAGTSGGEPETIASTGGFIYGIALDAAGNAASPRMERRCWSSSRGAGP